jgi:hypothetical protein
MLPDIPPKFRRETRRRKLSEDKSSLTVTVVDVELPPTPLPYGLVKGTFKHNYTSAQGSMLLKWTGTTSATYEVATRDGNVAAAVQDFLRLTRDRMNIAKRAKTGDNGTGRPLGDAVIPIAFSATETDVYDRQRAEFNFTYFLAGVPLDQILTSGGLWVPWYGFELGAKGGRSWERWQTSLPNTYGPRGNAVMVFRPSDDKIVDLCAPNADLPKMRTQNPTGPQVPTGAAQAGAVGAITAALAGGNLAGAAASSLSVAQIVKDMFPPPVPASSWLSYTNFIQVFTATGRMVGTTLPTKAITGGGKGEPWNPLDTDGPPSQVPRDVPFGTVGSLAASKVSTAGNTFVQQRVRPTMYVRMFGMAERVNYEVPCPVVELVNGSVPQLIGTPSYQSGVIASNTPYPIHAATWDQTFVFEGTDVPTSHIKAPRNTTYG